MLRIKTVSSGREYAIGGFLPDCLQYTDRDYRFNYIPQVLAGCAQMMTCGGDKLVPKEVCFSITACIP